MTGQSFASIGPRLADEIRKLVSPDRKRRVAATMAIEKLLKEGGLTIEAVAQAVLAGSGAVDLATFMMEYGQRAAEQAAEAAAARLSDTMIAAIEFMKGADAEHMVAVRRVAFKAVQAIKETVADDLSDILHQADIDRRLGNGRP
jgi:hypothetical protein